MSLEDPWMTVTLLLPQSFSLPHCDPVPPNPQHPLQVAISSGQAAPPLTPLKGCWGPSPTRVTHTGMGTQEHGVALLVETCSGISWVGLGSPGSQGCLYHWLLPWRTEQGLDAASG